MADKADIANDYIEWRTEQAMAARACLATQAAVGREDCIDCGEEIPAARRERLPGATTCVSCQTFRERRR